MSIINTKDGSSTLKSKIYNEHYHSLGGAISESRHIYINLGLKSIIQKDEIHIFEMGFGTGLNTLLTYLEAEKTNTKIVYHTIEKHPITMVDVKRLNYPERLDIESSIFHEIHNATWESSQQVSPFFTLLKTKVDIQEINLFQNQFDLIYYDAFSPDIQPELWTTQLFTKLYQALKPNGALVTYSSKGTVKRALRAAGFSVKRHLGPGSKWHVLSAIKSLAPAVSR